MRERPEPLEQVESAFVSKCVLSVPLSPMSMSKHVPDGRVPLRFIRRLGALGLECGGPGGYSVLGGRHLIAMHLWEPLGPFFELLRGCPVVLYPEMMEHDDDPSDWDRMPPIDETDENLHFDELERLIAERANADVDSSDFQFEDAAAILPGLVYELMDPPISCRLSHAAPDGTYLLSLEVGFNNLSLSIRIHRKRRVLC